MLIGLGLFNGYNLLNIGFTFSFGVVSVFGAVALVGMSIVPFKFIEHRMKLPIEVRRQRFGYMAVALASFMAMSVVGNRIPMMYPNSYLSKALVAIDHVVFQEKTEKGISMHNGLTIPTDAINLSPLYAISPSNAVPSNTISTFDIVEKKRSKKEMREAKKAARKINKDFRKKIRKALAATMCGLAVLIIVLLVLTTCAGLCLIVGGIAAVAGGDIGIGILLIILGPLVLWGSVKGITRAKNVCDET